MKEAIQIFLIPRFSLLINFFRLGPDSHVSRKRDTTEYKTREGENKSTEVTRERLTCLNFYGILIVNICNYEILRKNLYLILSSMFNRSVKFTYTLKLLISSVGT